MPVDSHKNGLKKYVLPYEKSKVPDDEQGIYFFNIHFPHSYKFGLKDDSEVPFEQIKENLVNKLSNYAKLYARENLLGSFSEVKKSRHLRFQFAVEGKMKINFKFIEKTIQKCQNHEEIKELISLLYLAFEMSPPFYIGITYNQSLRDRLNQHMDVDQEGKTIIKALRKSGLSWDDVYFNCLIYNGTSLENVLKISESVLHKIFKPNVSLR